MADKKLSIIVDVNDSKLVQTEKKLGQLKDFGKGLKIQYDIDGKPIQAVLDNSLNLQKQVKVLTAELRRTKEGTAEFQLLSKTLNDTKDNLDKTTAKSKDLFGTLSLIPGPVGEFASKISGAIDLMKTLSSFTFKDLTFQFKETANDIADIGENLTGTNEEIKNTTNSSKNLSQSLGEVAGQATATSNAINQQTNTIKKNSSMMINANGQVVSAYENVIEAKNKENQAIANGTVISKGAVKATDGLAASNVALAESEKAATFWTTTLGTTIKSVLISTGVLAAIVIIGELVGMLYRYVAGTEDAESATRSLTDALEEQQRVLANDLDAIDMANKAAITRAKIAGKSEEEIAKITLKGGQDRLEALRAYDNQLFEDQRNLTKNTKISAEDREKLSKDINSKILKNGQDITKQILANSQMELDEQLRIKEKNRTKSKEFADKEKEDRKTANQILLDLQKENTLAAIANERDRQYKELELQAASEVDKVNALKISEDKKEEIRNQIFLKYAKKQIALKDKFNKEDLDKAKELADKKENYLGKLEQLRIDAIANATQKEKEERQKKYDDELKDLDKALKDKIITQEQYDIALKNMQTALSNDLKKIQDDARKKENDDKLKKIDDDIKILQIQTEAEKNSFTAYWDDRQKLLDAAKQRELSELDITEAQKVAIEKKYVQLSKDLQKEKFNAYLGYLNAGLSAVSSVVGQQQQINQLAQDAELQQAGDNAQKQDEIKKKYFEKNKKTQIAQAIIGTLQGAVQAYQSLAVIPIVGPALGAVAAAAALVFGYKQVALIKQQEYQSSAASSGASAPPAQANYGKNYGDGGMINGPRHSQGGVPIVAEGGEAVMTRGAVTMFKPLLSMMNQMGGGTSFANATTTSYDNPKTAQPLEEKTPTIIKSYVVSSELTTEQQRQARLKDLSTL